MRRRMIMPSFENNIYNTIIMNTLQIIAMVVAGMVCLWLLAVFAVKGYVDHMSSPRKEKFVVKDRLMRVPEMPSEETHDVLAYSLGYS